MIKHFVYFISIDNIHELIGISISRTPVELFIFGFLAFFRLSLIFYKINFATKNKRARSALWAKRDTSKKYIRLGSFPFMVFKWNDLRVWRSKNALVRYFKSPPYNWPYLEMARCSNVASFLSFFFVKDWNIYFL